MPKFTKRYIDSLKPDPNGELLTWDSEIKGLGVRLMPSGTGSYLVKYRNAEGRQRKLVLGRIATLTPEEARRRAASKLSAVAGGADPSADRHAARGAMTVGELCDWYVKDAAGRIKESTLEMDRSRIARHVKPLLGRRAVAGLTLSDIERFQVQVAEGKTAIDRQGRGGATTGGKGVAARTVGMLGTILEFARRHRVIGENPARGVRRFPDQKVKRFLSGDELAALGKAMRESTVENKTGVAAVTALLLTGCRRQEVLALPWSWVDAAARCIRFGDTKSGAQLRPLGFAAVEHIAAQPRRDGAEWVFPADRGDGHFIGVVRVLGRLCRAASIKGVTVHTLRHTFAAVAAELGYTELTIAGLLGHASRGVTQRYAHVPDASLLSAADAVSMRIRDVLLGTHAPVAKVVPMTRSVPRRPRKSA